MPEAQDLTAPSPDSPTASTSGAVLASDRRTFLVGSGVLALAATAGASTAATFLPARTVSPSTGSDEALAALGEEGTVIALIRRGERTVTVMSGEREVEVDDPALVRALTGLVR